MDIDNRLVYSDQQEIRKECDSEVVNTGAIGEKVPRPNIAANMQLLVQVTEAFTKCTSLTVNVVTADNEKFDKAEILASASLPLNKLKAGKKFPFKSLPNGMKEFSKLHFIPAGTAPDAGKIYAAWVQGQDINLGNL